MIVTNQKYKHIFIMLYFYQRLIHGNAFLQVSIFLKIIGQKVENNGQKVKTMDKKVENNGQRVKTMDKKWKTMDKV